jgi:hypothetical protein
MHLYLSHSYADVMRRMREAPDKDGEEEEEKGEEGENSNGSDMEDAVEDSSTEPQPSATVSQSGLPASWSPSKSSGEQNKQ